MDAPAPVRRAPLASWLGGLAFVAALGVTVVRFGFDMRGDPSAFALPAAAADLLLFSVFALHHSILARAGAKRWLTKRVNPRLERSLYVWVASVLLILVMLAWRELPGRAWAHAGGAAIWHWLLVLAGVAVIAAATRLIDPLHLAGIRQASGDLRPDRFAIAGPYRFLRHPIYLGWMLVVFGMPEMTWTRLAFAVISSAYLIVAIPFEERSLVATFGETYRDYQRRVRWRIVPGIW